MTYTSVNSPSRSIVTAQVLEGGSLALLFDDDSVVVAGNVIGPQGEKGDRGMPGVKGDRGDDGNTIITVDGAPQPSDGKLGDWAIDKRAMKIYGPKVASGWGKGTDIVMTDASLDAAVKRFNGRSGPGRSALFGMGAPSAGISAPSQPGLKPIIGNTKSFPAGLATEIAVEADMLAFHCLLYAAGSIGAWYGEVVVARFGAVADWTVNWQLPMGASPPMLSFDALINLKDELVLTATSSQALSEIRGRIALV